MIPRLFLRFPCCEPSAGGQQQKEWRPRFATGFTNGPPYNHLCWTWVAVPVFSAGKGGYHDSCLPRQRVCAQRADGLSAAALRRTAGGSAATAGQVCIGGVAGGRICGGGVLAGTGVFGADAGQGRDRGAVGAGGLWRRAEAAAADAVVFRGVLRHGGVRAGIWTALRRCDSGSQRRFLYGCIRTGAAGSRRSGVCGADGGVPGLRPACGGGGAAADSGVCGRPGRGTNCAA